jgi:hypothetical protein
MSTRSVIALFAVLAAAAVGGMVVVQLNVADPSAAPGLAGDGVGGSELPTIVGTATAGRGLMSPAPDAPTRIVPVLDWNLKATTPLLAGRDCVASPATCHNGKDGIDLVYSAPSDLPAEPQRGTVLTDTGCEPDAVGASHCLNTIRLASGKVIAVRNDHRLANEPCLAPGERIIVAPGATAHTMLAELRTLAKNEGGTWPSDEGAVHASCVISDAGLKRAGITRGALACSKTT